MQKYANIFLHDIQTGDVKAESGKTLRDYINEYMQKAKNDQIHKIAAVLGLDEDMLRNMMALKVDDTTINEYGRLDNLTATVDKAKAKAYFEAVENLKIPMPKVNIKMPMFKVNIKANTLLRTFIISGGYDINLPE